MSLDNCNFSLGLWHLVMESLDGNRCYSSRYRRWRMKVLGRTPAELLAQLGIHGM